MPVYMGVNSCYARREGIFVARLRRPGIDTVAEAAGILALIVRDLRRGWTYDDDRGCRKIRMTGDLFVKRVHYVHTLAVRHGAGKQTLAVIDRLINYVLASKALPTYITYRGRRVYIQSLIQKVIAETR